MGAMASEITSLTIVYSIVYQSSASLAFLRGFHRGLVNFPHKWPVTRKMFPFHDVIMRLWWYLPMQSGAIHLLMVVHQSNAIALFFLISGRFYVSIYKKKYCLRLLHIQSIFPNSYTEKTYAQPMIKANFYPCGINSDRRQYRFDLTKGILLTWTTRGRVTGKIRDMFVKRGVIAWQDSHRPIRKIYILKDMD